MYSLGSPSASPRPATSSKHHPFVRLAFGFTSPCYFLETSSIRSARLWLHLTLHDRPDDPGRELLLADSRQLALAALARRHRHDLLEDLPAHLGQRGALED